MNTDDIAQDAPRETSGAMELDGPVFDITKQVWTFDPDDMTITVDGMWSLCRLNDEDDFPCIEDDEREHTQAEVVAAGNAIAALPELASACEELLTILMEGVLLGGPSVPIVREQTAKLRAMQALLKAGVPFGAARDGENAHVDR